MYMRWQTPAHTSTEYNYRIGYKGVRQPMAVIHPNLMCASDSLHNAIDIIRYVQCSHSEVSLCYNCST